MYSPLTYLAAVLVLGIAAQWMAWRLRVPAILLLLAVGFAAGFVVRPEQILSDELLLSLVSLSVAVILFEGGLSLRFGELREAGPVVLRLVTLGAAITWVGGALAARLVFEHPGVAALAGALFVVTGPTVVIPLLRHIRPAPRVGAIARWEGIVIDPIGALLTVLVFEAVVAAGVQQATWSVVAALLKTLLVALVLAGAAAALFVTLLRQHWIPDYLHNPVLLASVVAAFAASNRLQPESGLATVTLLGVILANQKVVSITHLVEFKENLGVVLLSLLFVLLASQLKVADLQAVAVAGGVLLAVLVLAVRPLAVAAATFGSPLSRAERAFLAWLAPRGIVAAAVASVFALKLQNQTSDPLAAADAARLVPLAFLVIVGTVAVYGLTAAPLARLLGIADPDPQGVLFVGAGPATRLIAEGLHRESYPVKLIDTNRYNTQRARMAGMPTRNESILSEPLQEDLDLSGIGRLLAMTPNDEVNTLAALQFARILGRSNVYQLPLEPAKGDERPSAASPDHWRGRPLFDERASWSNLADRIARGAVVKKTGLTAEFNYTQFRQMYGDAALVLFVIGKDGRLTICTAEKPIEPKPGQTLISLVEQSDAAEGGK